MSGPPQTTAGTEIDYHVPSDSHDVLQYFRDHSAQAASLQDLAVVISDQRDDAEQRDAVWLHHVTLPKPAETGIIDYDARSNTARYREAGQGNHLTEAGDG